MNLNLGSDDKSFGPDNQLPEWCIKKCKNESLAYIKKYENDQNNNIDTNPENLQIYGQKNVLVSFIGPHDSIRVKHNDLQIMIRGIENEFKYLQSNTYDIFNLQMYSWIAVPPNSNFMNNPDLHDKYLNNLIIKHKFEHHLRNSLYELRKKFLMNGKIDEQETQENTPTEDEISLPITNNANKDWKYEPSDKVEIVDIHDNIVEKENKQKYNFAIINIIGSKDDGYAIKINGLFKNEEDARNQADILKDVYSIYDHYVIELYRWIPLNVDPDAINEKVYQNEKINNMFKEHNNQSIKVQEQLNKHPNLDKPQLEIVQENDSESPSQILDKLQLT